MLDGAVDLLGILMELTDGYGLACLLDAAGVPSPSFSTGDPPELQRVYEAATDTLENDPSNVEAYFRRGVVCRSKGWYKQALADFTEVLRRQPKHARAWLLLSEVFDHVGEPDKARTARKQALELDPSLE